MELQQRRKQKRIPRTESQNQSLLSPIFCFFCCCCFIFIFLLSGFSIGSTAFHPILIVSKLSSLSSATNSIKLYSSGSPLLTVEEQVMFPNYVLLFFSKTTTPLNQDPELFCFYHEPRFSLPALSVDDYDESRLIARCPLPPANHSTIVHLQKKGSRRDNGLLPISHSVHSWDMVVYEAALDGNTAVVFVKGLKLRPNRASKPTQFSCHFSWEDSNLETLCSKAKTAAQEVVRCSLPDSIQKNPAKARGIRVNIGVSNPHRAATLGSEGRIARTAALHTLPSVAKILYSNSKEWKINKKKYELCFCTMVWNQASSLREWIIYHAWLGVERWFIYDNYSDDSIMEVIDELNQEDYNVSRHFWPWIKTQEAGFSHCALKARDECNWVGFMDVDEFFYFPIPNLHHILMGKASYPGRYSLRSLVTKFSNSTTIGEIRTTCHSFGPSGLRKPPSQGVMVGYTCRLQSPERHKSIVRPDALHESLLNVVHHFRLRTGYKYRNLRQSTAVINHYKYQIWEVFRTKFFRRVATYVSDWKENQNEGSKDRVPGLGTEAIEPPKWPLQFCEVWDTGLRDFVIANLADPTSGLLPWER